MANWDTAIAVAEADSGLLSKYHMRPMPMVLVLLPVYQHVAAMVMIKS